jgi:hypothetical protein
MSSLEFNFNPDPKKIKEEKLPLCEFCGEEFTKSRSTQKVCNFKCAISKAKAEKEAEEVAAKETEKEQNEEWKKKEADLVTLPVWLKRLEVHINHIARLIDKDQNCMMHGKPIKKVFGCHFHSVGANGNLRFNLLNIWGGCYSCNGMQGGNISGYEKEILKEYGEEELDVIKYDLVRKYPYLRLTKEEVKELVPKASKIVKELKKLDQTYTNQQRWELREEYNRQLNIYR